MTKRDLLILLIFATFLIAVFLPTLSCGCGRARRVVCATNLKSIGTAIAIYASGNHGTFPAGPADKNLQWLSDEPRSCLNTLESVAADATAQNMSPHFIRRWFYCPSNPAQNPDTLANWNTTSVMGYIFFNDRGSAATNMPATFPRRDPTAPPLQYHSQWNATPDPAESELAADWIVSNSPDATHANFTSVTRSASGSPTLSFPTSHTNGRLAAGANVLAFDGHVEWRSFSPKTASAIKQTAPTPVYFWLPASD